MNHHVFVLAEPPLSIADFCPDCLQVWEFCSCEIPTFDEIRETFEKEPHHARH